MEPTMNRHFFERDTKKQHGELPVRRSGLTDSKTGDDNVAATVKVLNQTLLIAHIAVLRCKRQYRLALRHHSPPLAADALEHANEAKLHADRITERILQQGGKPDKSPD